MANVTTNELTPIGLLQPLNIGLTPEGLLEELEQQFPERSPYLNETYPGLMWRGGQRAVVNWIRSRIQEDFENGRNQG